MRTFLAFLGLCLFALSQTASADPYAFGYSSFNSGNNLDINDTPSYNTDSGWVRNDGYHNGGIPGLANTNYFSGYNSGLNCTTYCADYFSFDLSDLSGTVTSASFNVYAYTVTNPGTFDIFATSLTPAQVDSSNTFTDPSIFTGIVTAPMIGTLAIGPGDNETFVTVTLDSTGLAWLQANEGSQVVLGGAYDYSEGTIPEPSSVMLFGTALLGVAGFLRRKRAAR
jgi:hypothetical protein